MNNEIPGMQGLCWSDLPLTEEQIYDLQMSGVFDDDDEDDLLKDYYDCE